MNSQEIVDYVMNTPKNTNPAILKQMIESSGGTGGVTSWNDLEDKPFGEEMGTTTLLSERTITIGGADSKRIRPFEALVVDETYTIIIDGVSYEIVCVYNDRFGGQYELLVNDNFFIYQSVGDDALHLSNSLMEPVSITITIIGPGKVVKTLDPKYLPTEEWTFTLEDGSTVTKKVAIGE